MLRFSTSDPIRRRPCNSKPSQYIRYSCRLCCEKCLAVRDIDDPMSIHNLSLSCPWIGCVHVGLWSTLHTFLFEYFRAVEPESCPCRFAPWVATVYAQPISARRTALQGTTISRCLTHLLKLSWNSETVLKLYKLHMTNFWNILKLFWNFLKLVHWLNPELYVYTPRLTRNCRLWRGDSQGWPASFLVLWHWPRPCGFGDKPLGVFGSCSQTWRPAGHCFQQVRHVAQGQGFAAAKHCPF